MVKTKIVSSAFIKKGTLYDAQGTAMYSSTKLPFKEASKEIYQWLGLSYPKFYKMDNLSKAAFLTAESLLRNQTLTINPQKRGLFIANRYSSLDTDERYHQKTFTKEEILSNPALFVYTLPNIMIGELSIRHQFKGEQCLWVHDSFHAYSITNYINLLFETGEIETCLVGWVDYYQEKETTFISLIEKTDDNTGDKQEFTPDQMKIIYTQLINI